MNRTETIVMAFFPSQTQAERAIQNLKSSGFPPEQIGLAAHVPSYAGAGTERDSDFERDRDIDRDTTAASKSGEPSLWDKIANFFKGRDGDSKYGYGDANYDSDNLGASLSHLGVPEDRARYFEYRLNSSDNAVLVTVRAADREQEAQEILERNGGDVGRNISEANYPSTSSYSGAATGQRDRSDVDSPNVSGGQQERRRLQLLGEVLQVHKERVSRGEVRVRKEVVTETQRLEVPVTREELVIERTEASGATPGGTIGADSELHIPLSEERVTTEKRPVVREEVQIGKRNVQSTQNVTEDVRREELQVDKDKDVNVTGDKKPKTKQRGA